MKISIFGKYGPYPPLNGATSAYVLNSKQTTVAFEFGSGAFSRVNNNFPVEKSDALILSHFHFDHCSDCGVLGYALLRYYALGKAKEPLKIYCPKDNSPLSQAIKSIKAFSVTEVGDGDEITVKDLKFRFYAVNHPVPCLGFRATDGEKIFAYGGDSNECAALDKIIGGADLALLDGGLLYRDWNENKPHLSVKGCSQLAKKHGVKAIITHLNPEYDEGEIIDEIAVGGGDCTVAEENKTYTV